MFEDHFRYWKQLTETSIEPTPTMSRLGSGEGGGRGVKNPERPESGYSSPECHQP